MSGCLAENSGDSGESKCELHVVRCCFEVVVRDVLVGKQTYCSGKKVTKDPRTCEEYLCRVCVRRFVVFCFFSKELDVFDDSGIV